MSQQPPFRNWILGGLRSSSAHQMVWHPRIQFPNKATSSSRIRQPAVAETLLSVNLLVVTKRNLYIKLFSKLDKIFYKITKGNSHMDVFNTGDDLLVKVDTRNLWAQLSERVFVSDIVAAEFLGIRLVPAILPRVCVLNSRNTIK